MTHPKIAFVFSGIGSQWQGMGTGLFSEDEFRTAIELCDQNLAQYADWTIKDELTLDVQEDPLERSLRASFCIFALQAGLVALFRKWGIVPDGVVGHSVGEFAAAYTAGVLTLKDIMTVLWHHHQIIRKLAGTGRMAHLSISIEEIRNILKQDHAKLFVSAINSPRATVVSGDSFLLQELTETLQEQGIFCRMLKVDVPLHSPPVVPYLPSLEDAIHAIRSKATSLPFYSTVLGARVGPQNLEPLHWVKHIHEPVLFAPAIEAMQEDGYQCFIEIGPHPMLKTALDECLQGTQQNYELFETLKRGEPDKNHILKTFVTLHHSGYPVNWEALAPEDQQCGQTLRDALASKVQENTVLQTLRQTDPSSRKGLLIGVIKETIREISEHRISSADDMQRGFLEMGLDSLMAVDLKNALEARFTHPLPSTLIFDYPTIDALADYLVLQSSLSGNQPSLHTDHWSLHTDHGSLKTDLCEPIAIIGMGCRFPGGANNPELFWELLKEGRDATSEVPAERWKIEDYYDPVPDAKGKMLTRRGGFLDDISHFDANFFGISAREAQNLDPQQLLLLEVAWEALEDAIIPVSKLKKTRTGVYIGICAHDFQQAQILSENLSRINVYSATGSLFSCAAGRLSYLLDLQGPNFPIDTACSSSLVALHLACQDLRIRQAEVALVGGVNSLLTPNLFVYFSGLGAISPDGRSKTFDASANGYGRGEGCGVLILKRLSDALVDEDRILAVIRGSSVNHDGLSSSFTAPNGIAQQEVIRQALRNAGVSPEQVQYIETHGTGTSLGDPIEVRALGEIYGKNRDSTTPLILGSVKANIGHLEGAAGVTSLIKTILALQHETIPPQIHFHTPNPLIPWEEYPLKVPTNLISWSRTHIPRRAGISAFGVSGTNAHVILEEAPLDGRLTSAEGRLEDRVQALESQSRERPVHLLNLSAKNESALSELATKYTAYLNQVEGNATINPGDVCYTANVGREHFEYRLSVCGRSKAELAEKLLQNMHNLAKVSEPSQGWLQSKTVFLFTGQGSQYVNMGRQLYETQPTFRNTLEQCHEMLRSYQEQPLLDVLYPTPSDKRQATIINQTAYTQPAIFAIEYALAELWQSWGIQPAAVIGHSIGEYVAACVAGVFSLKDALRLIAIRGRLMQSLPQDGMMAAVFADETTVLQSLKGHAEEVSIAAINAPASVVISGERETVDRILSELKAHQIDSRRLQVSHAFHSPLMNPILEEFRKSASEIMYAKPTLPLISNVSGTWASGMDAASAEYWTRHIREGVRFYDAMQTLDQAGYRVFLEIGADATLTGLGKRCLGHRQKEHLWANSLRKNKADWEQLAQNLGELYQHGTEIDWAGFDAPYNRVKVALPTYAFQRQHYELDIPVNRVVSGSRRRDVTQYRHPLLGEKISSPALQDTIIFQTLFDQGSETFLQEHKIYEKIISPAAAHIAMIVTAAKTAFSTQACRLEDVSFISPLIIEEDSERRVQVIIENTQNHAAAFQIASTIDSHAEWVTHCKGHLILGETHRQGTEDKEFDLDAIQARCPHTLPGEEFHQRFKQAGYDLGPGFQRIQQSWYGERETLSRLEMQTPLKGDRFYERLPGLIDSILQSTLPGAFEHLDAMITKQRILIPYTLLALDSYAAEFTETLWAHSYVNSGEDFIESDITVRNEDGERVLDVKSFIVKETDRERLLNVGKNESPFYAIAWEEKALTGDPALSDSVPYLIFADRQGWGAELTDHLERHNASWVKIWPGDSFEQIDERTFSLNPYVLQDFITLFEGLQYDRSAESPQIIFLWGNKVFFREDAQGQEVKEALKYLCESLLNLVKALENVSWEHAPRLWILTQRHKNPLHSILWGIGRVISLEYPELGGTCIDVEKFLAAAIVQEMKIGAKEDLIAYSSSNRRHVARLRHLKTLPGKMRKFTINADASYLVSGGLGSLGMFTVEWLVQKGARHLILLGRNAPKPDVEKRLEKIREHGVNVLVKPVDVSDEDALRNVLHSIQGEVPILKGIIHAAGVIDDGVLIHQDWQRFQKVLLPKGVGAWNLHTLTVHLDLDFFVMFSSIASLLGNQGQANYAAANTFLDTLAEYRRDRGLTGASINWGPWADSTMTRRVQERLPEQGLTLLEPEEALANLESILSHNLSNAGVMYCYWEKFLTHIPDEKQLGFFSNIVDTLDYQGERPQEEHVRSNELLEQIQHLRPEEREVHIRAILCKIIAEIVGAQALREFDQNVSLNGIGVDSLMAIEMRNQIHSELHVDIPMVKFLEGTTLGSLVSFLNERLSSGDENEIIKVEL